MIESIGHTTDGNVWMRLIMTIDGQQQGGIMEMTRNTATWVRDSLTTAIANAEEQDVGNSANPGNGGVKGN